MHIPKSAVHISTNFEYTAYTLQVTGQPENQKFCTSVRNLVISTSKFIVQFTAYLA